MSNHLRHSQKSYHLRTEETGHPSDSPSDSPGDSIAYYLRLYSSNLACLTSVDIHRLLETRLCARNLISSLFKLSRVSARDTRASVKFELSCTVATHCKRVPPCVVSLVLHIRTYQFDASTLSHNVMYF